MSNVGDRSSLSTLAGKKELSTTWLAQVKVEKLEDDRQKPPTTPPFSVLLSFLYSGCLVLVYVMGDSGIINVLLSLQKDVIDVLNKKIYDMKQEEVAQGVEKEEGVRC